MDTAYTRRVELPLVSHNPKPRKKIKPARRSDCAVACTLDLIGDRWTLLVVRDLLAGKRYFDEFLRSPERIATNILAARLRALQEYGFIEKVPDPSDQRRFAYRFTNEGLQFRELLGHIARWGQNYLPATKIMKGIKLRLR
jgi:DNA-binding HxlR family transcriptional regulator